jgi:Condensation domain
MSPRSHPASFSQRLMWQTARRLAPGATDSRRLFVIADLDVPALERALTRLRQRHEALRTRIVGTGAQLTQEVFDPEPFTITWVEAEEDLVPQPASAPGEGVVVRAHRAGSRGLLHLTIDHLLTDAWSNEILSSELTRLYTAECAGREVRLSEVGWQYHQFAEWQLDRLTGPRLERLQRAWLQRLDGVCPLGIAAPAERAPRRQRVSAMVRLEADEQTAKAVSALAAAGGTTVAAAALALYYLALSATAGQDDLTIGSIFANRMTGECWRTVGPFAHVLPLRLRLPRTATVVDLLREAHVAMAHALANQELPMPLLPTGVLSRQTAIGINSVVFHILPGDQATSTDTAGEPIERAALPAGRPTGARFDLELALRMRGGRLRGFFRFAPDRFTVEWVEDLRRRYGDLIMAAADDPHAHLAELLARLS